VILNFYTDKNFTLTKLRGFKLYLSQITIEKKYAIYYANKTNIPKS